MSNHSRITQSLLHLLQKNNTDDDCIDIIETFITKELPEKIADYKKEKSTLMERLLQKQEYVENFLNNKDMQYHSEYNEHCYADHLYICYDNISYEFMKYDDIYHKIIKELNPPSILSSMKRNIAEEILLEIENRSLFEALPESSTIQKLIDFFCPTFFETKEEFKYFLTVIGDCILDKRQDIVYYIPELSREFITVINLFYKDYFGKEIDFSMFKFKYRGHDYEHSRIIQIKKTISSISFLTEYIKKNIFNIIVVSCHYSNRYENAEKYIEKQSVLLQNKVLYLTKKTKQQIVNEFLRTKTKTLMSATISQNDMYFLWKLFCDSKDLPLIMYKASFIACLDILLDNNNNIYENVTSEFLKPAIYFKKFWEKSISFYNIENENSGLIEDEYEISELCELYNIWLKEQGTSQVVINEKDMKELILYFYPKIEVKNKSIQNIYCSYWNKKEDMRDIIESRFASGVQPAKNMSFVQAYLSYVGVCNKQNKINCCSKKYFENYIKNIIPGKYIKNKTILKEYWQEV